MPDDIHDPSDIKATVFVLGTTDLHMQLLAYDYFADRPTDFGGLIPLAREIERIRTHHPSGTFLFDNGDFLQGNPLADFSAFSQTAVSVHPMVQAMNTLKYDAVCLGNHEFNYGLPFLKMCLKTRNFRLFAPILNCEITTIYTPNLELLHAKFFVLTGRTDV